MGRKCNPDLVKKEVLIKELILLGLDPDTLSSLSKNELVWLASDANILTDVQIQASLYRSQSTIPCYMYTHIEDPEIRKLIDSYVQAYSLLYSRGMYLANLVCMKIQYPEFKKDQFPREFISLPLFLRKGEEVKKCFFPERWMERKNNNEAIDPLI